MRYLRGSVTNQSITPTTSSAVGRWNLADQYDAARQGIWPALGVTATGGTATTGNGYNQWSFTTTGSSTFTVTNGGTVYYAIVAGGGAGGFAIAGGGGGGVVLGQTVVTPGTYTIVVGAGGAATTSGVVNNGSNSSAFGYTAVGGGGGESYISSGGYVQAGSGGSGGGGIVYNGSAGVAGQGWYGGNGINSSPYPRGGGGGAGGIGISGTGSTSGSGGPGIGVYLPVSASTVYYGGGGGGAGTIQGCSAGSGGTGGGGAGGSSSSAGNAGTANTGGGGGGGGNGGSLYAGGAGGSGIVVIWSPIASGTKTPYLQYLTIAGGGSGGIDGGGGGGAGGVLTGLAQVSAGTAYTVTIGAGGASITGVANTSANGYAGSNSSFGTFATATGGGYGSGPSTGGSGGSGGGGSNGTAGGVGTTGQGYAGSAGATDSTSYGVGGGGGGYGGTGSTVTNTSTTPGANGGDGYVPQWLNNASWSVKFNGSTDYFSAGTSVTNFLCTGGTSGVTATFEAWVFPTQYTVGSNANYNYGSITSKGNLYYNWGVYNGYVRFYWYNGGLLQISSANSTDVPLYQWTHIALTINGSTVKIYINGNLNTTSTGFNGILSGGSGTTDYVGIETSGNTKFAGYISNIRINNTIVYGSNFTPSTTALTAISGTQLLTCQNSGFVDNSSNNYTVTPSGSPVPVTYNPFGVGGYTTQAWSNYFNGTSNSYLSVGSPTTALLNYYTSYTIEFWVFLKSYGSQSTYSGTPIVGNMSATGPANFWSLGTYTNGTFFFYYNYNSGSFSTINSSTNIPLNTWTHIAFTGNSGTGTIYINGVNTGSGSFAVNNSYSTSYPFSIGSYGLIGNNCYISNLRVTNTVVYSSNFTPPTSPLTAISGTQLLTCQSPTFVDNSSNNFSFTTGSSTAITSQNPFGYAVAGGGGGSGDYRGTHAAGYGGMGGGGAGLQGNGGSAVSGAANTGAGGGGVNYTPSNSVTTGAGGSGIVVLAYPSSYAVASSTTGSPTVATANGIRTYTFTSSGSITI